MEFWFQPDWNGNTNVTHTLFEAGRNFDDGMLLAIDGANNLRFIRWGDDHSTSGVEANVERGIGASGMGLVAGTWYHLAATWDDASRSMAYYLDGKLLGSLTNAVAIPSFSTSSMTLGAENGGANPALATLDEVRISNRARTASEILSDYNQNSTQAGPNQAILWNQVALQAIENDASTPEYASRGLAIMSASVYDAVNAIDATPGYYVTTTAPGGASADAAAASAAYTVLSYLYPAQQAFLNASFTNLLASIPAGHAKTDGESVGQSVANTIIALRQDDGSTNYVDYTPSSAPGDWQPTAPTYSPAENPQWATLKPFAMTSDTQFQPPAPPSLTSQDYASAVNETLNIGSVNSTTRTADETQIAQFWNDKAGTYSPPGHWNAIADAIAQQQGDSLSQDARLLAELNIAEGDAAIVAWNAKYLYNTWRPITLANGAGAAVNGEIETIANWTPLLTTPPFPEYVSGHSTFSGAAAEVLSSAFGDNFHFSATSVGLPGVTRTYTSFEQAAEEAGISRIYGGIHFTFSNTAALTSGRELGDYVLQAFSTTQDTTPPRITLNPGPSGGASKANVTVTGTVIDNLSGVASLAVSVDGASSLPLSFDPTTGVFSFATSFATDGSQEGAHAIEFHATDLAGNVSPSSAVAADARHQAAGALAFESPRGGRDGRNEPHWRGRRHGNGDHRPFLSF